MLGSGYDITKKHKAIKKFSFGLPVRQLQQEQNYELCNH
ncbi:hypothetical protein CWATWH0003_2454 [Crocosphaera watsonii WH 0003]|uniref:Uncharacterized protein n=2 Tax=Crocosphaera watsonii TaxID=263511 RepID=G5J4N5_CROWT|nr:hypothetical protein CWATWH0003_2454 [Crocosphaera watsonii WH 0003]CCQ55011.1 hypothetical protein CWATWH0005_196 [Crocosphaera watsonii WH 0005]